MDLSKPATAVVPSADADVLTVVAGTTRALTGREIQRLSGVACKPSRTSLSGWSRTGFWRFSKRDPPSCTASTAIMWLLTPQSRCWTCVDGCSRESGNS